MTKYRHLLQVVMLTGLLLALSLWCWLGEPEAYSDSERRTLAQQPELTWGSVLEGDFMADFEEYTQDQFPARDTFRTVKAMAELGLFLHKDSNDLYLAEGHISRLEYPVSYPMLDHAAERFRFLYDSYLKESGGDIYFSIIPDKNYYLAEKNGYLSLDYEELISYMREQTEYMEYIDITGLLSADDYYRTDTHWKQEDLLDVAQTLAAAMGVTLEGEYETVRLEKPFYGVYYGQSALPLVPDLLTYLTNGTLESCTLTSYDTGSPVEKQVYDLEKAAGRDPYELFLSGSDALQVLENPNAGTDRELLVFRDSYASSLVPLLAEGYSKITLIDIRYVNSSMLGELVDFHGQDVLFLYSTLLLNSSMGLR